MKAHKLLAGAVLALLAYYAITNPLQAAAVRMVLGGAAQFAAALTGGAR